MMTKREHAFPTPTRRIVLTFAVALTMALTVALAVTATAQEQDRKGPPAFIGEWGEYEIVLIHGLGGDADIWDDVLPFLKGTFRVWTFEMAGHGRTQPIPDPTIDKEAERLGAFLKEQGVIYPTLVGHALGGMIALKYTLDHPADVSRLILLDAAPMQLASQEQKAAVGQELANNYDKFVYSRFINMTPNEEITERIVDTALRTDSATFISLLMSSFDFDVSDQLYSLPVPMLVVGSELMFPGKDDSRHMLEHYGFGKARSLSFKRINSRHSAHA